MLKLIKKKSRKYKLPWELVCSIIWQESRGNPWASRVEEGFYARYIEKLDKDTLPGYVPSTLSLSTEKWHRSTSWGLMQLMGETMREEGFRKNDLTRLCIPAINLEFGCRYFRKLLNDQDDSQKYITRVKQALAQYNTGRPRPDSTNYDEEVLGHLYKGSYQKIFE